MNLRYIAALLFSQALLFADGGRMLFHQVSNGLVVTLFASPSPMRAGIADFSVFIEDAVSSEPLLDASVALTLTGPHGVPAHVNLNHLNAANKLLYAGQLNVDPCGSCKVLVEAKTGSKSVILASNLEVLPTAPGIQAYWPFLTPVPLVIGLFAANRLLRRSSA